MSFLNIEDPKKRDAIVADYLAMVKRLQKENLNEKTQDYLVRKDELKEMFNPVVQSTEKSTEAITKELIPLREEVKHLNEAATGLITTRKQTLDDPLEHYTRDKSKLDKYFGIQYTDDDDRYMMGDKEVMIDKQSNIFVDGVEYKGTPGLWALVMLAAPTNDEYTTDDFVKYGELVNQTNVMLHPRNLKSNSRPTSTFKWRYILQPHREGKHNVDGEGIQFLPGDIKGLTTKLHLLLAEFAAGNRSSTRNEIVFILDELLRRKEISRKEYTDINSYLSRCL